MINQALKAGEYEPGARWEALGRRLEDRIDDLTAATLRSLEDRLPEWMREPPLWDQVVERTRANCLSELRALRAGGELPEACPETDAAVAREAAGAGLPLTIILDAYRAGHQAIWDAWSAAVDELCDQPEPAASLRRRGSDFFFAYATRMSSLATDEYMNERERSLRGTVERRRDVVRALLDGEESKSDLALLDYPVEGWHLGIVASGRDLAVALERIRGELDCKLMLLDEYPDPWWAWLGRSRPFDPGSREALARLAPGAGGRAGMSTEQSGVTGFRESHRQAAAAFRVATAQCPLVRYPEIALEELASHDRDAATAFIASELGGLASDDRRTAQLRATLAAYFESGQNARKTASRLGVHHQTVAQRLEAVEQRVGCPVCTRRAELELALRLQRYFAVG